MGSDGFFGLIHTYINNPIKNGVENLDNDILVELIWHMNQYHLSDKFYQIFFSFILIEMKSEMTNGQPFSNLSTIVLIFFSFILGMILFNFLISSEEKIKYTLELLLHFPIKVITSNIQISKVLCGKFWLIKSILQNTIQPFSRLF
jgi:hypothetical protein